MPESGPPRSERDARPLIAPTILFADDDQELANLHALFLRRRGYDVLLATDGEEALAKIVAAPPTLVVADLRLPKLDGWRLCQRIKQDARLSRIPVILLSGLLDQESGRDELADASLPKPCPPERLLEKIRELLVPPAA